MKHLILASLLLGSGASLAAVLKPPFAMPSAAVLPKGVRNLSFKGIIASGTEAYNNDGTTQVLADPFFQNLDFENFLKGELDPVDRAGIQAKMDALGFNADDSFGSTSGNVNVVANVSVPVLAYGVTDKFTVAVAVPFAKTKTNVSTGVTHANKEKFEQFRNEIASSAPLKDSEFYEKISDPINYKIKDYNYEPLENQDVNKLGDIKLVAKYKTFEDIQNVVTMGLEVTLPTGEEINPNKVVDIAGGDGQTDVGLGVNYDFLMHRYWTLAAGASYTAQLPDHVARRVPERSDSTLSPDLDNNVNRDLGDVWGTTLGLKYAYRGFSIGSAYAFQYKDTDSYSGTEYETSRYDWLSINTTENMHTALLEVGYDTITLYKEGGFPVPLSVKISHSRVLAGKNVVVDPLTTLDFSMFF